ncbi:HNH endonuclease [Spirosoma sp. BT702]|uniref:HNH endonuclease n=1 Tax=Spirosoma profusum TaxID=2771354 RepID=A0A927GAH7_9BACT|nr:HNH endonuclease signature motif containing protein [Spirosoma profusum]MBD2705592.1 HNH endonuclease [Spirosoma profusum]
MKKKPVSANQGRANPHREIYGSSAWRKDSLAHREQNPLCAQCYKEGRLTPGTVSDHIVSINQGGDVWDWENRQNLCKKCHARKSNSERNS